MKISNYHMLLIKLIYHVIGIIPSYLTYRMYKANVRQVVELMTKYRCVDFNLHQDDAETKPYGPFLEYY